MLLGAISLVKQIKAGCDALHEGRLAIDDAKKTLETASGDIKSILKTATGIWGFFKRLFSFGSSEPESKKVLVQAPVNKTREQKEEEESPEFLQAKVIIDISDKLGKFFDIQQKLLDGYKDLEITSQNVYDPNANIANMAIQRVTVELQLEWLSVEIREAMVYAPKELKDIYSRFLKMYSQIQEEQAFARREMFRKANEERWLQAEMQGLAVEIAVAMVAMAVVLVVLWTVLLELASLSGMRMFSLQEWCWYV
jgi:hypothetical protein